MIERTQLIERRLVIERTLLDYQDGENEANSQEIYWWQSPEEAIINKSIEEEVAQKWRCEEASQTPPWDSCTERNPPVPEKH